MATGRSVIIEERVTVPDTAFDHAGYRAWVTSDEYPERVRTTFVGGEVLVEISPETLEAHSKVKAALTAAVVMFVQEHDLGETYPDGALVTNEDARLSTEPDFTFVAWESFESGRVRLQERAAGEDYIEIVGSPDLVVEVVSDSSVRKDTRVLREAYHRADVREYWLIDARGPEIRFEILFAAARFQSTGDASGAQASAVLGGRWSLTRTRNRAGRFTYRLDRS